jgi:cell wall-associated NlpC family hydrolase
LTLRRSFLVVLASLALAGGCASASGPFAGAPGAAPTSAALRVVSDAHAFTGTAYRPGGADANGFDCSGFVQFLYGRQGIRLPRTAADQFGAGAKVAARRIAPGDLVFFRTAGRRVSHVGVALGDGTFLHAPNVGSRVRMDRLEAPYWSRRFAGARRVTR